MGLQKELLHGGAGRARGRRTQGPCGVTWGGETQKASAPGSPSGSGPPRPSPARVCVLSRGERG